MLYNEDDYMIAPCRFAKSGWKYIKKDSVQQFLNHPNKVNSTGFVLSGNKSVGRTLSTMNNSLLNGSALDLIEEESQIKLENQKVDK